MDTAHNQLLPACQHALSTTSTAKVGPRSGWCTKPWDHQGGMVGRLVLPTLSGREAETMPIQSVPGGSSARICSCQVVASQPQTAKKNHATRNKARQQTHRSQSASTQFGAASLGSNRPTRHFAMQAGSLTNPLEVPPDQLSHLFLPPSSPFSTTSLLTTSRCVCVTRDPWRY